MGTTHYAMFILQAVARQLHFLANRNAELAVPQSFWPKNGIQIGGRIALLRDCCVYLLFCHKGKKLESSLVKMG